MRETSGGRLVLLIVGQVVGCGSGAKVAALLEPAEEGVIGTAFGVVLDSELIQSQEGRPLVRLDPVIVGGAVATAAPQQGIDEGLTDKLAVAIG